jgi:predicted SpoU family rRNA methylase
MYNKFLIYLFLFVGNVCAMAQTFPYIRDWGTYYGNSNTLFRDAVVDSAGNMYVLSNISENSSNDNGNYTTPNAHQTIYGGGIRDLFITKFTSSGILLWATYYGGEGDEYPSNIVLKNDDTIFIVGSTNSTTNIATSAGFQTTMVENNGIDVNESAGFIAKFSSDGELLYSTYYDGEREDYISSIVVSDSNFYIYGQTNSSSYISTPNSFQPTFIGTSEQPYLFIAKFTDAGERLWSTYYGAEISDDAEIFNLLEIGTMDIDENENIYFAGTVTDDTGYYASSNDVSQPQNNGNLDTFISKFDTNGNRIWSTYYGGTSVDVAMRLAVNNNIYLSGYTYSDNISIGNVHQTQRMGASDDFLLKMDLDGQPIWATYFGGIGSAGGRSYVTFGEGDSVWLTGLTYSMDGIATAGAFQTSLNLGVSTQYKDAYFARFNNSGQLDFASYYGGEKNEISDAKTIPFGNDYFYIVGSSSSLNGIATQGALQETVISDNFDGSFETLFVGKFKPKDDLGVNSFNTNTLTLWPNPSAGVITLTSTKDTYFNLKCYDVHGRLVKRKPHLRTNTPINLHYLSSGIYFLEITSKSNSNHMFKVVFE